MESKKARQLTPDDLGRVVTVHDAVYSETYHYLSVVGSDTTTHKLAAVSDILTSLGACGKVAPGGRLFTRPKTVHVRLGSMLLEVDAGSVVELAPREAGKGRT